MRKRKSVAPVPPPQAKKSALSQHGWLAVIIGLCMAVAASSVLAKVSERYWSACAFGGVALFSALGHSLILTLQRRQERALQPHAPDAPPAGARRVRTRITACLVGAFAVVPVCLWPVLLVEMFGWSRMKDVEAEIISPGDTVKLSVDGPTPQGNVYRVRYASAVVKNPEEVGGPATFPVSVENHPNVPTSNKETRGDPRSRYLIQTTIPNEPGWEGKTVRVQIHLILEDTDKQGRGWIVSGSSPVAFPVSPEGASERYREAWWIAFLAGAVPAVLLGFVLSRLVSVSRLKPPA